MANKKLIVGLAAGVLCLGVVATVSLTGKTPLFNLTADEQTYSVTLDATNADSLLGKSTGGASLQFVAEGLTEVDGKLGKLSKGGYIALDKGVSLNNLKSLSVASDNYNAVQFSYAFEEDTWLREDITLSETGTVSLDEHPNYIKISASDDVTLDSVTFTYTTDGGICTTPTATPKDYQGTTWQIVGGHNGWNTGTGTKFTLNTKNPDLTCIEYKASVKLGENTEFKIIQGSTWDAFNQLELGAEENLLTIPAKGNNRGNAVSKQGVTLDFYLKISGTTTSVWVAKANNPVAKDDTDTTRVYFEAPASYGSTVYAYTWDNYGNIAKAWPGTQMTLESGNLYYVEYQTEYYTNVIFNNNNGAQTNDLVSPTDGVNVKYVVGAGWVEKDYSEPIVTTMDIYVDIGTKTWTTVTAHLWGGSLAGTSWPGKKLTNVSGKIWKLETFNVGDYINIIFSGNGLGQTGDLKLPEAGGSWLYTLSSGTWTAYTA